MHVICSMWLMHYDLALRITKMKFTEFDEWCVGGKDNYWYIKLGKKSEQVKSYHKSVDHGLSSSGLWKLMFTWYGAVCGEATARQSFHAPWPTRLSHFWKAAKLAFSPLEDYKDSGSSSVTDSEVARWAGLSCKCVLCEEEKLHGQVKTNSS